MDLFIIGDVHGCFFTYLKLLQHWNPRSEYLIQLGDLVDRGNHSPKTIRLSYEIQLAFKKQTIFLKGNHEQLMQHALLGKDLVKNWERNGGTETMLQFERESIDPYIYISWIRNLPLFWENKKVFISHAGIAAEAIAPWNPDATDGLLWNRKPLQKMDKLQVVGHTPLLDGKPEFLPESNAWNIDTGAYKGICLTGIKIRKNGTFIETISVPTDKRYIKNL